MNCSKYFFIFFLTFSTLVIAEENPIITKISKFLPPGASVQDIKESKVEGLYVVDIGRLEPLYATNVRSELLVKLKND